MLLGFLDRRRATLAWKTSGPDASGLNANVARSALTLGGLLKHMAGVEDFWYLRRPYGRDPSPPWDAVDWSTCKDWEFISSADDMPAGLRDLWLRR